MKIKLFVIGAILLLAVGAASLWWWPKSLFGPSNEYVSQATPKEIMAHVRSLQASIVVLNVWASWCGPCREEFPSLMSLKDKYHPQGLEVVFVSVDNKDDLSAAEAFLREHNVSTPSFYKGDQPLRFITEIYPDWTGAVPANVIFNSELKILEAWEGETSFEEFESILIKHMKGS